MYKRQLLQSFQPAKNATRDARKPPQTEAVTEASASTSKRLHAQQRSAQRLADYNEAKRAAACGARWQPIVQTVLSRSRAKQRAEVWTSWMRSKKEARAKLRNLFLREWRRPHLEYKVPKPTPPGSRWQRLPTVHDLLSPLSYRDRHILNRAKNFVAVAEPRLRGTNKCAWAWLRRACPYSDSDFDPENYGVNHAESPPPRANKATLTRQKVARCQFSALHLVRIALAWSCAHTPFQRFALSTPRLWTACVVGLATMCSVGRSVVMTD